MRAEFVTTLAGLDAGNLTAEQISEEILRYLDA